MKPRKYLTLFSLIILFTGIFLSYSSIAQNQPPQVTNVHFSQRSDCSYKVDIYYDLSDPDGNAVTVAVKASNDNGSTWTYTCPSLTGNIGTGQTSGTNKHIIWDFGTDHPNTFDTDFKIKIIADDGILSMGQPCPGLPSFTYGGQTYNTVQIGTQCWMKENLNIGTMINASTNQTNNAIIEKYCYNNDPAKCTIYGGLYQWNEMMQYSTIQGVQGICFPGWHLPTDTDWCMLLTFLDPNGNCDYINWQYNYAGKKIKEIGITHWYSPNTGATNESGFSALGAGYSYSPGYFNLLKYDAVFWSTSEYNSTNAWWWTLYYNGEALGFNYNTKTYGCSVRCLKNP